MRATPWIRRCTAALCLIAACHAPVTLAAPPPDADRAWIAESNAHAAVLLEILARYAPEAAAGLGVEGHDADILDLRPRNDERFEADVAAATLRLEAERARATDPRVQQDLDILLEAARRQATTSGLERRLMLPYVNLAETMFRGFSQLLDPRVAKERYPAALVRLERYTGRAAGYEPATDLARARSAERFATPGLTGPWTVELEQGLGNRQRYVDGMRGLFEKSGLTGWQEDFAVLEAQLADYEGWVRREILPRARPSNRLPPEIYANNLRNFGVEDDPRALMQRALTEFQQTRDEMDAVAALIAKQRGLPSADYRKVLAELKKQKIPGDRLLDTYRARLVAIEQIIRRENLITLPERQAAIRLATEAESAQTPAPHLNPPRLIGNTGEPAEFVLPLGNPNAAPGTRMDDFDFDAITWSLTAHEARPGHELQFMKMVEEGVSIPRAVFAFNSANVEGWALYAEAIMKQYYPLEGQLGALQFRLMRAARAFLDPMVNLGLVEPARVQQFLVREVGLSAQMAQQEADRYSFRAPGQATAYFYGCERLQALRASTELTLGTAFEPRAYHDFLIAQGMLPPELLEQAVAERFVKPRLASASPTSPAH